LKITKLAGIDIGSNSVRLNVSNAIKEGNKVLFKKSSLSRLPIRLGADTFRAGKISPRNVERLCWAMEAFDRIMKINDVEAFRACATSAIRESKNRDEVIEQIAEKTGIRIEAIDGVEEARLIFSTNVLDQFKNEEEAFLYIDVGGGSTEFSLINGNEIQKSRSFTLGTIRILNGSDKKSEWKEMKAWLREICKDLDDVAMIGSGGNINRIFKMSGKPAGVPLSLDYLEGQHVFLKRFTADELVKRLDLNIDRADVIVPATRIYISAMEWSGCTKMYVPKVGLSDGIVRDLYHSKLNSISS
jgi:exopolyphosphatase/guanosine-5'-triphosphate,3'-diphosphate pyrophosphatase